MTANGADDGSRSSGKRRRSLIARFRCAFRGVSLGMVREANFRWHLAAATTVVVLGILLRSTAVDWCLLALASAAVMSAELMNSAIEHLAEAVTQDQDERLRDALDIASGAVLLMAAGAAAVGLGVFGHRLWSLASG